jgi:hypothetical protein
VSRPSWAPAEIDLTRPSAARVYDFYLGGFHNFAADRQMAQEAMRVWPELPKIMQANRGFLRRAVNTLVRSGVDQFIDIGSGIPTVGSTHEVAQQENRAAKVVYVDVDPVAVAHSRAILSASDNTVVVQADLRQPERILTDPAVLEIIDLDRPIAVLLVAVLHFVSDEEDPAAIIARLRAAMAPGSFLVISHATYDREQVRNEHHRRLYSRTATPMNMRSREQIANFFNGFTLLEPGLVPLQAWRPETAPVTADNLASIGGFAGVGSTRCPQ